MTAAHDAQHPDLPPCVRKIETPGEIVSENPLTLTPEAEAELQATLDAIAESRARATTKAHEVVIWR